MPQKATLDDLIEHLKADCMLHMYGNCNTLACLWRGGYPGLSRAAPTCENHEWVEQLEKIKKNENH